VFRTTHLRCFFFVLLAIIVASFAHLSPSYSAGFGDVAGHWLEIHTLEIRVNSGNDDVEELNVNGEMYLDSTDLELTNDESRGNQTVGLRFNDVQIDQGARIYNAYVQFTVDKAENSNPCNLTFRAQAVDNAEPFTSEPHSLSSRGPVTSARATWSPGEWDTVGAAGYDQITVRIAAVIQEVVDRPGWVRGNSMVLTITGTGKRVAESYEGDPAGAPLLYVEVGPTDENVNFRDFTALGDDWLKTGAVLAGDANRDNIVDFDDLRILAASWLCGCSHIDSYSQHPYSVYFICNQNVTEASISRFDQETLDYFWDYIAELEDTGVIDMPEPADLQDCNEPEYCPYIYLTDQEGKKIHAAKTAHSIYLDKNELVPWRLAEYTNDELDGLFNKELLFSTSGSRYYYFSVVDHSPSDVYGYILGKELLQDCNASPGIGHFLDLS